ncbi:DUF427 domain protein [Aspergillus avenaceus]|uniref:DUF427 domain protein n=1 Tax=Aspergillus avenaceus TaxID=36643 RepID=A0A5N6TYG1_ASPAV|nr:DUF427 domain protein [Aspergillus avenaceus]
MSIAKATVRSSVLAETKYETLEGNVYFPPWTITDQCQLVDSDLTTYCGWKGHAKYYHVVVEDITIPNAAWYYPEPYEAAANIKGFIAFDKSKIDIIVE